MLTLKRIQPYHVNEKEDTSESITRGILFLLRFQLVLKNPSVCSLLGHSLNALGGVLGLLATVGVEEVLAILGNVESLLITCRIAIEAVYYLLYNGRSSGIVLSTTNNLLHLVIFLSIDFILLYTP